MQIWLHSRPRSRRRTQTMFRGMIPVFKRAVIPTFRSKTFIAITKMDVTVKVSYNFPSFLILMLYFKLMTSSKDESKTNDKDQGSLSLPSYLEC